jgi:MFS family permease
MTAIGIPYQVESGATLSLITGSSAFDLETAGDAGVERRAAITEWLATHGYNLEKQVPPAINIAGIFVILVGLGALSGATFGSVAALLSEMFPPRIRYSSMSIPYHIGTGYFGGFLPLIAGYIVARTGDIFAGLWYTWVLLVVALAVAWWGLPNGPPRDFADEIA